MELSSYESYSEMQNTDDIKTSVNFYNIYCIPRKYNVPLIITNLTSALNSLKFLVVNVLRYAHAHVKHVKNRYHKGTLKWQD